MKKKANVEYLIEPQIVENYVNAINSYRESMSELTEQLKRISESMKKLVKATCDSIDYESIHKMSDSIKKYTNSFSKEKMKIMTDAIRQIINTNNGMISTRMIEPINISRQYLSIMEKNDEIEKVSRGVYVSLDAFEDSYFSFQQKYKKAIFSHMNALYFYGLTEEFPSNYSVTVPQRYHVDTVNNKCNVFYVADNIYDLGLTEVKTPSGNKVRAYDKERCICDIIRSINRMDQEQVKKTIKNYVDSSDKDMAKLSMYAKKMRIHKKVMEMVGGIYNN